MCVNFPQLLNAYKMKYSKTCHLRSLVWVATCPVRPPHVVKLSCDSIDFMFILPLFCEATCLLRPIFVENFKWPFKAGSTVF